MALAEAVAKLDEVIVTASRYDLATRSQPSRADFSREDIENFLTLGDDALRVALEPTLVAGDVDVVLAGHEHFYERVRPQHGIAYFVSGAGGSLRPGDIRPSKLTAAGFDEDFSFMLFEVSGEQLFFQSITRSGRTVDAGVIQREGERQGN